MTDILFAKIDDAIRISSKRPTFMGFLDETEGFKAQSYLKSSREGSYLFWGGHDEARRVIIGFFPDYMQADTSDYPIEAITFTYRDTEDLSHRNFLGSFMSMGVTRASIGDILIEEGRAVAFVKPEISELFMQNLSKIGKVGVRLSRGFEGPLPEANKFEDIKGVVASMRIDCVAAFIMHSGREKAADAIKQGLVSVNHTPVTSVSYKLKPKDIISIRKKGRFIVCEESATTAKGRLVINLRKYI